MSHAINPKEVMFVQNPDEHYDTGWYPGDAVKIGKQHGYDVTLAVFPSGALRELERRKQAGEALPAAVATFQMFDDKSRGSELIKRIKADYPGIRTVGFTWSAKKPYLRQPNDTYDPAEKPEAWSIRNSAGFTDSFRAATPRAFQAVGADLIVPNNTHVLFDGISEMLNPGGNPSQTLAARLKEREKRREAEPHLGAYI